MDWELAKELREAGFPQSRGTMVADPENPEDVATVPDLPQFVDACGDFLGGFAHAGRRWRALAGSLLRRRHARRGGRAALALTRAERAGGAEDAWFRFRRRRRAEGPDPRTMAADLDRLVRQAQALRLVILPYLIDMALLEAERLLRDGD